MEGEESMYSNLLRFTAPALAALGLVLGTTGDAHAQRRGVNFHIPGVSGPGGAPSSVNIGPSGVNVGPSYAPGTTYAPGYTNPNGYYGPNGYYQNGYNQNGYNQNGYNQNGYYQNGYYRQYP